MYFRDASAPVKGHHSIVTVPGRAGFSLTRCCKGFGEDLDRDNGDNNSRMKNRLEE
jgi:hypothetical protein